MRASSVFLLGMLSGVAAISLANYMSGRFETTPGTHATTSVLQASELDMKASVPMQVQPAAQLVREHSSASNKPARTSQTPEAQTDAEWNALIGGMLEWEVEYRTGKRLSATQRERLVAELARLREASLAQQEAPEDPGNPAELRERIARTLTIAQVDTAFRKELGIGVADFVAQLDPDAVEDVSRTSQP